MSIREFTTGVIIEYWKNLYISFTVDGQKNSLLLDRMNDKGGNITNANRLTDTKIKGIHILPSLADAAGNNRCLPLTVEQSMPITFFHVNRGPHDSSVTRIG